MAGKILTHRTSQLEAAVSKIMAAECVITEHLSEGSKAESGISPAQTKVPKVCISPMHE